MSYSSVPFHGDVSFLLQSALGGLHSQLSSIVQGVCADAAQQVEAVRFQAQICVQAQVLEVQQLQQHLDTTLASLSATMEDFFALREECRVKDEMISRLTDEVSCLQKKLAPLPDGVSMQPLDGTEDVEPSLLADSVAMVSAQSCLAENDFSDAKFVLVDDADDEEGSLGIDSEVGSESSVDSRVEDVSVFHVCSGVRLIQEVDPSEECVDVLDVVEGGSDLNHDAEMDCEDDGSEDGFMDQFLFIKDCVECDDGTYPPEQIAFWKTLLAKWYGGDTEELEMDGVD